MITKRIQTMITILAVYVALSANVTFAQQTYTVDLSSNEFYGKIYLERPSEVFSPGWIAIIEKKTGKELLKVESEELAMTLHDGKPLANVKELPYGEQSVIMYEDYNFDGKKDFAIQDGQNSCYHGPSYKIYLADNNSFTFSKDFTRLAQEYCGMFDVNAAEKKLNTMIKSGCCWHKFSDFIVENNKPKAIYIREEDADLARPFIIVTEETWNGKNMVKTSKKTLELTEETNVVLSFQVEKNNKQVVLLNDEGTLIYALLKQNGVVEFSYPECSDLHSEFKFHTTPNQHFLTFGNKKATYTLYEDIVNHNLGIKIQVDGKTYDWKGVENTKKGSLNLLKKKFGNVMVQ